MTISTIVADDLLQFYCIIQSVLVDEKTDVVLKTVCCIQRKQRRREERAGY